MEFVHKLRTKWQTLVQIYVKKAFSKRILQSICLQQCIMGIYNYTSLAAPGALANRLQRRTARKANEVNSDFPNLKTEIICE